MVRAKFRDGTGQTITIISDTLEEVIDLARQDMYAEVETTKGWFGLERVILPSELPAYVNARFAAQDAAGEKVGVSFE